MTPALLSATVQAWAAWSPGLEERAAWEAWLREPAPLAREGAPPLKFLPALQRRRCDQLSRMMLEVLRACGDDALLAGADSVFASRHGSFSNMAKLLEAVAEGAPLSPAGFSHSVHNTQAGLFSIWAKNRNPSSCIAAGAETFEAGFLDAAVRLRRDPARPVLLVVGDEPIPELMAPACEPSQGAWALALVLAAGDDAAGLRFGVDGEEAAEVGTPLPDFVPDALAFLAWWLSDAPELRISRLGRTWRWRRGAA